MNRYVFTADSVKELARCSELLFKTFSKAKKDLIESPSRSMLSDFHLDYTLTPEKYYYYMDADSQAEIHKIMRGKTAFYTIRLYNIYTELPHCEVLPKNTTLYNECYGTFKDIDTCISVYKSILVRLLSKYSGNEYTKLTDYARNRSQQFKDMQK